MRLKKKAGSAFLTKLLGGILLVLLCVGAYISPWGEIVRQWCKTGWEYIQNRAEWRLGTPEDVMLVGHKRTSREEILNVLHIVPHQQMNHIDFEAKKQRLEKLPWVRQAVIERKLPNKLKITIFEKTPIARWQNKGKYFLLDEEAHPIDDKRYLSEDLILVVGEDAPNHVLELLADLDKVPEISRFVRSAQRVENRRWNLRLRDAEKGMEIILPQTNVAYALAHLDQKNKKDRLLKKDIATIDMRSKGRIIIRPLKEVKSKKVKK